MRPRVTVTHSLFEDTLAPLKDKADVRMLHGIDPLTPDAMRAAAEQSEALITLLIDPVTPEILEGTPVRVVSNVAVGYDNIDVEGLRRLGIAVCHTPGVLDEATADTTMLLLLAVARRFRSADAALRGGRWGPWALEQFCGTDLHGATLGIVGFGRIGKAVARRALAFGMNLLVHTRTPQDEALASLGARSGSFEATLRSSDYVSLHVPLTPETHHMINAYSLSMMKPTAALINTARGGVVDEAALLSALSQGQLAGAGLDVYQQEPLSPDSPLLREERIVALPHIGSATWGTRRRMAALAVENVLAALDGTPQHVV